jgi:hypothetical protein
MLMLCGKKKILLTRAASPLVQDFFFTTCAGIPMSLNSPIQDFQKSPQNYQKIHLFLLSPHFFNTSPVNAVSHLQAANLDDFILLAGCQATHSGFVIKSCQLFVTGFSRLHVCAPFEQQITRVITRVIELINSARASLVYIKAMKKPTRRKNSSQTDKIH